MPDSTSQALVLQDIDTVAVALRAISAGASVAAGETVNKALKDIPNGHGASRGRRQSHLFYHRTRLDLRVQTHALPENRAHERAFTAHGLA